jgi:hypothetical protein
MLQTATQNDNQMTYNGKITEQIAKKVSELAPKMACSTIMKAIVAIKHSLYRWKFICDFSVEKSQIPRSAMPATFWKVFYVVQMQMARALVLSREEVA